MRKRPDFLDLGMRKAPGSGRALSLGSENSRRPGFLRRSERMEAAEGIVVSKRDAAGVVKGVARSGKQLDSLHSGRSSGGFV